MTTTTTYSQCGIEASSSGTTVIIRVGRWVDGRYVADRTILATVHDPVETPYLLTMDAATEGLRTRITQAVCRGEPLTVQSVQDMADDVGSSRGRRSRCIVVAQVQ